MTVLCLNKPLPAKTSGPARCCSQRLMLLIVTLLIAQDLAPASWYRPTVGHCSKVYVFLEKCHYFRNDDPYRHETQHNHVLHMVITRLCAKFRRHTMQRLGGDRPQTKQTNSQILVDVCRLCVPNIMSLGVCFKKISSR